MYIYTRCFTHGGNVYRNARDSMSFLSITVDEKILKRCIKYWEQLLEKPVGCKALDLFFAPNTDRSLVSVLLCITSTQSSQQFATLVLRFFNVLFEIGKIRVFTHDRRAPVTKSLLCNAHAPLSSAQPRKEATGRWSAFADP